MLICYMLFTSLHLRFNLMLQLFFFFLVLVLTHPVLFCFRIGFDLVGNLWKQRES